MKPSHQFWEHNASHYVQDLIKLTERLEKALAKDKVVSPYENHRTMESGLKAARDYLEWITGAIEKDGF